MVLPHCCQQLPIYPNITLVRVVVAVMTVAVVTKALVVAVVGSRVSVGVGAGDSVDDGGCGGGGI